MTCGIVHWPAAPHHDLYYWFWVVRCSVLSVIMCSFYWFLGRMLFQHNDGVNYWDFHDHSFLWLDSFDSPFLLDVSASRHSFEHWLENITIGLLYVYFLSIHSLNIIKRVETGMQQHSQTSPPPPTTVLHFRPLKCTRRWWKFTSRQTTLRSTTNLTDWEIWGGQSWRPNPVHLDLTGSTTIC